MTAVESSFDRKSALKFSTAYLQKSQVHSKDHKQLIISNLGFLLSKKPYPSSPAECKKYIDSSCIFPRFSLAVPKGNKASPAVKAIYKKLIIGRLDLNSLLNLTVLKAFFVKNPHLLQEMRGIFQDLLIKLAKQAPYISKRDYSLFSSLVGNILSFLVYFNPLQGEKIQIPQYLKGKWQTIEYIIERIELTPKCLGSPMVAFGFTPSDHKARPFLVFKGTTYPADDGFVLSLLSDVNIGGSPGAYAFYLGRSKIKNWLKSHPRRACIYGQSLGGILALQTVNALPQYVAKAAAFSPTALLFISKKLQNCKKEPQVRIYDPKNDIVTLAGLKWHPRWRIYRIFSKKKYNFVDAHTQIFLARKKILLVKVDPAKDQAKLSRWFVALLHLIISIPLFLIGLQFYAVYLFARQIKKA